MWNIIHFCLKGDAAVCPTGLHHFFCSGKLPFFYRGCHYRHVMFVLFALKCDSANYYCSPALSLFSQFCGLTTWHHWSDKCSAGSGPKYPSNRKGIILQASGDFSELWVRPIDLHEATCVLEFMHVLKCFVGWRPWFLLTGTWRLFISEVASCSIRPIQGKCLKSLLKAACWFSLTGKLEFHIAAQAEGMHPVAFSSCKHADQKWEQCSSNCTLCSKAMNEDDWNKQDCRVSIAGHHGNQNYVAAGTYMDLVPLQVSYGEKES